MPIVLAIDDDPWILATFRKIFAQTPELRLWTATTAQQGIEIVASSPPDAILLDINLPDVDGLETFRRIQAIDARIPVIFVTGQGTTESAIEAMKLGAYEYLLKPLELPQLRQVVDRALAISRLMHVPAVMAETEPPDDRADAIIGRCPAMQEVY